MATKVQLLRERLTALRESGAGAGWDCFAREDLDDAEDALKESQRLFRDARKATTAVAKSTLLFNGALALQRAEGLIESWERED